MTTAQAKPTGFSGDHGALTGLGDDDHLQYALLAGRALGQTLHGGTAATEELNLMGSSDPDLGQLHFHSPTLIDFDLAVTPVPVAFDYNTVSTVGVFNGGFIRSTGTITTTNAIFIWALLGELKTYRINANPGFAAFTLFNALPAIENQGNFNLVQGLILNVGLTHRRRTAGTSSTGGTSGMNFSPQTAGSVAGALMTKTGDTGIRIAPTWNTVAGSVIQFGTVRGVQFFQPAQAIFGSSAGTEQMTAYYGLDFPNMTFGGGTATYSVIRSLLNAGTNKRFLDHTGNAASRMRGNLLFDVNNTAGVFFGASNDVGLYWSSTASAFLFAFLANNDQLRWSGPAADRFLLSSNDNTANEFNFDFTKFSFGQAGAVGNQVGVFVAQTRTVGVGGGWADFLLTQAGSLSIGAFAMSDVSAWVINAISLAAGTGSIADLSTLVIGGMTTSNPGITVTRRSALRSQGRFQQSGSVAYPPIVPAALASGNNNDWAGLLTGSASNNTRFWARISGNATTSVLTGIDATAVQDGDTFELTNVSANTIDIAHQNVASAAANRIISPTGATYQIAQDETVLIRYDLTTTRWRLLAGTGA